jgi:[histone H3]-N6,N6-dimethyl-lysine9 N-methyltransferase
VNLLKLLNEKACKMSDVKIYKAKKSISSFRKAVKESTSKCSKLSKSKPMDKEVDLLNNNAEKLEKLPSYENLAPSIVYFEENALTKFKTSSLGLKSNVDNDPQKFIPHVCSPKCTLSDKIIPKRVPTLVKPLYLKWNREIVNFAKSIKKGKFVIYTAPCGKHLRNMKEVYKYLKITKCSLSVDNFTYEEDINVFDICKIIDTTKSLFISDFTNGKEVYPIPVYNVFDVNETPPKMKYLTKRDPQGFEINTDDNFKICCDCEDDCNDDIKCACAQMTIKGMKKFDEEKPDHYSTYNFKRLFHHVFTGVYECHSGCKCYKSKRCLNTVVQHPIQVQMQLRRTANKGWGVFAKHDIPRGSFICNYVGKLYREDEVGSNDVYFAQLDYIETMCCCKEDYEEFAAEMTDESDNDSDYMENPNKKMKILKLEELKQEEKNLKITLEAQKLRKCFKDSGPPLPHIMDARTRGNIAKFFNVKKLLILILFFMSIEFNLFSFTAFM